jgi:catechol 2,3-dioxygenase-like lactoylglutathione lyase family enzyme
VPYTDACAIRFSLSTTGLLPAPRTSYTRGVRLQHVGITVPAGALPDAQAFYGGLLALPELSASERALVYGLGADLELHVITGEPADPAALHHFALEVDDLTAARRLFEDAEHAVQDARPVGGRERCFVRDPFGNLFELVTPRAG